MKENYVGPEDRIHKLRPAKMWDNHGRRYSATLDKKNATPVAQGPRPDGWRAPWMPGQEWFRYHEDEEHPNRFRIDYDSMLADRIAAHEDYERRWNEEAIKRGWDPTDKLSHGKIEAIVGKRPLPIEPIVAAMQGNKYVLGQTDKVDARILPFLREKPQYKRAAKHKEVMASMDFSFDPDDELEQRMDLQDEYQPDDQPIAPKQRKRKAVTAPEAA